MGYGHSIARSRNGMMTNRPAIWLVMTGCCLVVAGFAHGQSLTASVDHTIVYRGEQLEYVLEAQGTSRVKNLQTPSFVNFRVISGPNESTNFQIINGRTSRSIRYSWRLIPKISGKLLIGPASGTIGKSTVQSNPVTIQVLDPGAQAPKGKEPPDVMVKVDVSKREVYVNQPIKLTYKLLFRKNLSNYEVSKLPNTVGFWSEDMPAPEQARLPYQMIQGHRYGVLIIRRAILFPTNSGDLTLDPLEVTWQVQERSATSRRRSRSVFDNFFDDPFFGSVHTVTKSVTTNPIHLKVKPLPLEGRPEGFAGDVGRYNLRVSLEPRDVTVNETVTLKVTIQGSGNIRLINEPQIDIPLDIERYDPKITHHINKKSGEIQGHKVFEYLLIPRVPGQMKIPPISFAIFDPKAGAYKVLMSDPMEITVRKGTGFAARTSTSMSREDVRWRGQDIRYIKLEAGDFRQLGAGFHRSAVFYGLLLAPFFCLVFGLMYRQQRDRLEQDVDRARRSRAYGKAIRRLKTAAKSKAQESAIFYGNLWKVLGGYMGDILNLSESAGGSMDALEALAEREVDGEIIGEIREIFTRADFQRFASGMDTPEDRDQLLVQTKAILQRLEKGVKVR